MKKLYSVLFILLCLVMTNQSYAQKIDQPLTFVYMCCDFSTNKSELTRIVSEMYDQAIDLYDESRNVPYIFYLSDNLDPKVIFINVDTMLNNEDEFEEKILASLNSPVTHNVMPRSDIDSIVNIFNRIDFIDEEGNLTYESFTMDFYVSESFWSHEYNISVISYLYWILGLEKLVPTGEIAFNVNYSQTENDYTGTESGKNNCFGEMNLLDINNESNIWVMSY